MDKQMIDRSCTGIPLGFLGCLTPVLISHVAVPMTQGKGRMGSEVGENTEAAVGFNEGSVRGKGYVLYCNGIVSLVTDERAYGH